MSDYTWNRRTPDVCECGFEKKVHVDDRCPWDRDELVAMRRAVMTPNERVKYQPKERGK
jgi:hypothetical protein